MKLLDKYAVMEALNISESAYNKLIRDGTLSYVQFSENGKRYVPQETVDAFILNHLTKGVF